MPAVSIVIPVRNGERYVADAIRSVLNQTLVDWELVVVNDGSTDGTAAAYRRVRDSRITVMEQPPAGLSKSRNTGLVGATGKFFAFLDADDTWEPEYLEAMHSALETSNDVVLGFAPWQYVDEGGRLLPQRVFPYAADPERARVELAWRNALVPSAVVVSAPAFRVVGGFAEETRACEDWDLWLRLRNRGRFVAVPSTVVRYRTHPASMSHDVELVARERLRLADRHLRASAGPTSEQPAAYRRAVAHTLIATGLAHIQEGAASSGVQLIYEGVGQCPESLDVDDVLFELGAAFEPRGVQGTGLARHLAEGAALVDEVLVRAGREGSRPRAALILGRLSLAAGDRAAARRHALCALRGGRRRERAAATALAIAACLPGFVGRLASARTSAYRRLQALVLVGRGRARISE